MPNWCDNQGFIRMTERTTERGREIFKKLAKHGTRAGWFSTVYPPPAEMHTGINNTMGRTEYMSLDWLRANSKFTGDFGVFEGEPGEYGLGKNFKPTDAYLDYLRQTFGATNWYNWSVKNWGTKWDVELSANTVDANDRSTLHFLFSSAWSPPIGFFLWLSDEEIEWSLDYIELGCWFAGHAEYTSVSGGSHTDFEGDAVILFAVDRFDMEIEHLTCVEDYESFDKYTADHKHGERVMEMVRDYYANIAEHAAQTP